MAIRSKLEIIRDNVSLDISDETNYIHESNDGFGATPLHRLEERGPLQHGITDRGYRLDPRIIQLVIGINATSWSDFYAKRDALLDHIGPVNDAPLKLRFTLPDEVTQRQIDCYLTEGPSFQSSDIMFYYTKAAFRLSCPDPVWYDPTRLAASIGASGGTGFMVPIVVPWLFGGTAIDTIQVINLAGNWIEYPEIAFVGPLSSPQVENLDTGEKLDFTPVVIGVGDTYTVDLRYGYKTVVDAGGNNKIDELTNDSDLSTWHLKPGENSIHFVAAGTDPSSRIIIRYYVRYIGV